MLPNTAKVPQKWRQYLRLTLEKKNSRTVALRSVVYILSSDWLATYSRMRDSLSLHASLIAFGGGTWWGRSWQVLRFSPSVITLKYHPLSSHKWPCHCHTVRTVWTAPVQSPYTREHNAKVVMLLQKKIKNGQKQFKNPEKNSSQAIHTHLHNIHWHDFKNLFLRNPKNQSTIFDLV